MTATRKKVFSEKAANRTPVFFWCFSSQFPPPPEFPEIQQSQLTKLSEFTKFIILIIFSDLILANIS